MPAIKRFDASTAPGPAPVGTGAQQQMFGTLADRLAGFADRASKIADIEAAQEGKRAGEAAAAGRVGGVDIPDDITIRDQAFAKGARAAHAAAIQTDIRTAISQLELNNQHDIQAFSVEFDGYKSGLLGEIDESMQPMAISELTDYSMRSKLRIEANMFKKGEIEQAATLNTAIDGMRADAIGASYDGDEDLLMTKQSQYFRLLDEGVESNIFDKDKVEGIKREFNNDIDIKNVTGVFDRTIQDEGIDVAEKAYGKFIKSKHRGVDPVVRDKIITRMKSSLSEERARIRSQLSRQKAEITAREKALASDVKNAEYALDRGYQVVNLPELIDVSRGTKHEKTLRTVQLHQDRVNEFVQNSPAQMDAVLSKISEKKKHTGDEIRLIERLKKTRDYTRSELDAGRGMDLALQQGIISDLPPLQAPGSLEARAALSKIATEHYAQPVSPLTDNEVDDLKANLDVASSDEKIQLMGSIVDGLGNEALPVLESLANKNSGTYAVAGSLMVEGRPSLGRDMIKGVDARAAYPKIIPPDFDEKFNNEIKTAYTRTPKQVEILRDAMRNMYASRAVVKGDYQGAATDTGLLNEAFTEVTGGVYTMQDQGSGFFHDSRYDIEAPRVGVDQDAFIDWMENLTQVEIEDMGNTAAPAELTKALNDQSVKLVTVGDGRYQVLRNGLPVVNEDLTPFLLTWPQ